MERNKETISKFLDFVKKTPYLVRCVVIEGFGVHVHYDSAHGYFRASFHFNPSWPHTNGVSGKTKDEFIKHLFDLIDDAKKIYTNGGKFPSDYYNENFDDK